MDPTVSSESLVKETLKKGYMTLNTSKGRVTLDAEKDKPFVRLVPLPNTESIIQLKELLIYPKDVEPYRKVFG